VLLYVLYPFLWLSFVVHPPNYGSYFFQPMSFPGVECSAQSRFSSCHVSILATVFSSRSFLLQTYSVNIDDKWLRYMDTVNCHWIITLLLFLYLRRELSMSFGADCVTCDVAWLVLNWYCLVALLAARVT